MLCNPAEIILMYARKVIHIFLTTQHQVIVCYNFSMILRYHLYCINICCTTVEAVSCRKVYFIVISCISESVGHVRLKQHNLQGTFNKDLGTHCALICLRNFFQWNLLHFKLPFLVFSFVLYFQRHVKGWVGIHGLEF